MESTISSTPMEPTDTNSPKMAEKQTGLPPSSASVKEENTSYFYFCFAKAKASGTRSNYELSYHHT